jgi:hypothetical protein
MNIFTHLFGSKKNNDEPDNNLQKQPRKPEPGKSENKINQNPDSNTTYPPIKPKSETKKNMKRKFWPFA